jgi:hypothetical protein
LLQGFTRERHVAALRRTCVHLLRFGSRAAAVLRWYDRSALKPRSRRLLLLGLLVAFAAGLWVLSAPIQGPKLPEGASSTAQLGEAIRTGIDPPVSGDALLADVVDDDRSRISGTVRTPSGEAFTGVVQAFPESQTILNPERQRIGPTGQFDIVGATTGKYELVFSGNKKFAYESMAFPGIRAGSTNLQLVVPEEPDVGLTILLQPSSPISKATLLVAQPKNGQRGGVTWPVAPANQVLTKVDWPEGRGHMPPEGGGTSMMGGRQFHSRLKLLRLSEDPPRDGLSLRSDVYVFGIDAWDSEGRPFAPVLSEPARFDAGEYELTFVLQPTASIVGRVDSARAETGLEVIALDLDEHRLPLFQGSNEAYAALRLNSDGRFRLDRLPAGTVIVRAGSPTELERGFFGVEQRVEIDAGETETITLQW